MNQDTKEVKPNKVEVHKVEVHKVEVNKVKANEAKPNKAEANEVNGVNDVKRAVDGATSQLMIAVDPGREKTGIALMTLTGELVDKMIVPTDEIATFCAQWLGSYSFINRIVCGNGTNHNKVSKLLEQVASSYNIKVVLTDEAHTTEEARRRYFEVNPPKGLKRLLPKGMLLPSEPVDDFTAWIIGERYLQKEENKG
ncbi:hypothetical protein [uncultured Veillonella sp.]|uniref:hypothetical protein n=1 Tax=uncultured Veillonella sp. TaxID=159268 RepID=UPI0025F1419E|nr:hypothetical protein [uncultured Veillonella sp.]